MEQKQTQRTDLLPRGWGGGGGMAWEFRISRCKLLSVGWINNMVLLYSTWNHVVNHNGKKYETIYVYN